MRILTDMNATTDMNMDMNAADANLTMDAGNAAMDANNAADAANAAADTANNAM